MNWILALDQVTVPTVTVILRKAFGMALHNMFVGRASETDPREASIVALSNRYGVDPAQSARVEATALRLFDQVEARLEVVGGSRHEGVCQLEHEWFHPA